MQSSLTGFSLVRSSIVDRPLARQGRSEASLAITCDHEAFYLQLMPAVDACRSA